MAMAKGKRATQHGQNLVEAAITLPLVFLVLMGIFDLSRAVYYQSVIANAAREGARAGTMNDGNTPLVQATAQALMVGLNPTPVPTVVWSTGVSVTVTIPYRMQIVTPMISAAIGGRNYLDLTGKSTMRLEE